MKKAIFIIAVLSINTPSHAGSANAYDFFNGTGSACIVGGTVVGLTAFLAGPSAIAAASAALIPAATTTTSVAASAATLQATAAATTIGSALLGCGASAAAAVVYYSTRWVYSSFVEEPPYPLLYPLREELATPIPLSAAVLAPIPPAAPASNPAAVKSSPVK